jgi:hypothetical protein
MTPKPIREGSGKPIGNVLAAGLRGGVGGLPTTLVLGVLTTVTATGGHGARGACTVGGLPAATSINVSVRASNQHAFNRVDNEDIALCLMAIGSVA